VASGTFLAPNDVVFVHRLVWQAYFPHRYNLKALVDDAHHFVQTFANSIEDHPLLIYLSAVPFTPIDSLLSQSFLNQELPHIVGGYERKWSPLLHTLCGHSGPVDSVAYSADGQKIVSGSCDKTVRIWDSTSGMPLLAPLRGHCGAVDSVAFSPDGTRIVSSSEDATVRIWDAASGLEIFMRQMQYEFNCGITFSPDGQKIALGV
jgi:WD40 repeat protein